MIGVCHGAKLYLAKYKWEGFFASESSCVKRPVFSPCEPLPAGANTPKQARLGGWDYQMAGFLLRFLFRSGRWLLIDLLWLFAVGLFVLLL
ncbi:hypothetical protein LCGC14_0714210 [marine sediment metagenome]|uniref:Uncharacterized protein n=1 Tax=marine sediment metagenome TaxID=412755 RepID=A0A0F9QZL2_9ZZZZ